MDGFMFHMAHGSRVKPSGREYEAAGRPEEAVRSFQRAMRISPIDPLLHSARFLEWGWPLSSSVALTRPSLQGRKPSVEPLLWELTQRQANPCYAASHWRSSSAG